jgi:putative NIF3 family GTP cyclohydrolase 1 type 2
MKYILPFLLLSITASAQIYRVSDVLERMRQQVQPQWNPTPTDTIVIGNGADTVTGIATCMFVDMHILRCAVAARCNLIITHEPTFYIGNDQYPDFMKNDSVLLEKRAFIEKNRLTILRFHDNGHRTKPDQIMQGLADQLGWKVIARAPWILEAPRQKLKVLARGIQKTFGMDAIRVIGNPDLEVQHIALVPGLAPTLQMHLGPLQRADVDVVLVGEAREWEDYLYVQDAVMQGRPKAAIFMGHHKSEEPGMKYCAQWLKTFLPGVKIEFLEARSYWWTPK